LKKNWRAAGFSIAAIIAMNAASMLLLGYETVFFYYTEVGSMVSWLYRAHVSNFSLWSLGWRLFEGNGSLILAGAVAPPIFMSVVLARGIAVILPLLVLIVGLALAHRSSGFDTAFSIMICVSILVNPVVWIHYLILALLPLCVIARGLLEHHFPKTETNIAVICGLLLLVSVRRWYNPSVMLGVQSDIGSDAFVNPWILVIFTMLSALLILILIWLLYRLCQEDFKKCVS
jgi:hypothetical protein